MRDDGDQRTIVIAVSQSPEHSEGEAQQSPLGWGSLGDGVRQRNRVDAILRIPYIRVFVPPAERNDYLDAVEHDEQEICSLLSCYWVGLGSIS
jgi:hypothetical protein